MVYVHLAQYMHSGNVEWSIFPHHDTIINTWLLSEVKNIQVQNEVLLSEQLKLINILHM